LSRYTLLRKIASGGMGEVYCASAAGVGGFQKTLVVKRIHPHLATSAEFVLMFLNEARLAALLNHPNVVQIFDLGEEEGTFFIAMEFVDGPSLQGLCSAAKARGEQLPLDAVVKIGALCCEGLAYAHASVDPQGKPLKLVHRDISPDNILLSRQGAVKVADFGIARAANLPSFTQAGSTRGKTSYLSPEALLGKELDGRADVFALAVVLFYALSGVHPFKEATPDATRKAIATAPPRKLHGVRPDAPPELQALLERALVKDPARRISAADLGVELEKVLLRLGSVVNTTRMAEVVNRLVPPEVAPASDDPDVLPPDRFDASGRLRPPPPPPPDLSGKQTLAQMKTPGSMVGASTQPVRTQGPATEPMQALSAEQVAAAEAGRGAPGSLGEATTGSVPGFHGDGVTGVSALAGGAMAEAVTGPSELAAVPAAASRPTADEELIARERARREAARQKPRRWPVVLGVVAALGFIGSLVWYVMK
jgi:serine/threonine-protein kinase